jgi:hypothetical protein
MTVDGQILRNVGNPANDARPDAEANQRYQRQARGLGLDLRSGRGWRQPGRYAASVEQQYVAFQGGLGRPATTVGPNDAKVDNPPVMFVFASDATAELPRAGPPVNNNRPAPPAPETQQSLATEMV